MSIPHSKLAAVCSFTFADGRQCRTPRASAQSPLCYFHEKKEAELARKRERGRAIGTWVTADYLTACDLSHGLGQVFSQTLQGNIKPRTAVAIAYLAQTMLQTIKVAQHEFINGFGTETWRAVIRSGTVDPTCNPKHQPVPAPASAISTATPLQPGFTQQPVAPPEGLPPTGPL